MKDINLIVGIVDLLLVIPNVMIAMRTKSEGQGFFCVALFFVGFVNVLISFK